MDYFSSHHIEQMAQENDLEGLYKCIEYRDPIVQLQAAQSLADLNDETGWRYLLAAVSRADAPEFQATAAAMLGELGQTRAVPALSAALKKARGETADAIRNALEAIPGPEAEDALRQAGYEPVLPTPGWTGLTEYEAHYVRPVLPDTGHIHYHTAEEHLNTAVELRENEITERGLVENGMALWLKPDWAYAWYLRGVLLEDLDRTFEALLAYRRALEIDPTQPDAREAMHEIENDSVYAARELDLFTADLSVRDWRTRRDAAAGIGDLALHGDPSAAQAVDGLITLLQDEEREVRQAAAAAVGLIGSPQAVEPLLAMGESSWLNRFTIIQALSRLRAVDALVTVLRREMTRLQERNPVFSSQKDPLLEVEYDLLMEIGVRALENTGDLDALLRLNENNAWEIVEEEDEEDESDSAVSLRSPFYSGDSLADDLEADDDDLEADEDLTSYVDEVAEMAAAALDRLAQARLGSLAPDVLARLAQTPDLTLVDLTVETDEGEAPEPAVVYDLEPLRKAAQAELHRRAQST